MERWECPFCGRINDENESDTMKDMNGCNHVKCGYCNLYFSISEYFVNGYSIKGGNSLPRI